MFISIADLLQTKVREPLIFKGSCSSANGVVLLKAARVQIPASPPNARFMLNQGLLFLFYTVFWVF